MSLADLVRERGITEVLHFTTNEGLVGVLESGAVLPRSRLPKEKHLEYIYKPNCKIRKDTAWLNFVNLSISWINPELFRISEGWHRERDIFWCILSFDSAILMHAGVHFATTNNMYSGVHRGVGEGGFLALFDTEVVQYVERSRGLPIKTALRPTTHPMRLPTCSQAEVLYPEALSLDHLKGVYAPSEDLAFRIHATASVVLGRDVEVWVYPDLFQGNPPEIER